MGSDLQRFCRRNDLPWDERRRNRFEEYLDLLEQFNDSMNLVGPLSRRQMIDELLIDSLTPAAVVPPTGSILDVGTGAGLPGLPLKILAPGRPLTLVEPRRKRATFLRIAVNRLELDRTQIENRRIEQLPERRDDYVVSKAFRPPAEWLEVAANRLSDDGVAVCMTTPDERSAVEEARDRLDLVWRKALDDVGDLGAPGDDRRTRAVYVLARRQP